MGRRNVTDPAVRRRIEHELLNPADPPRSRAAIAREHAVSPRTVSRIADDLGLPPGEPWKTDAVRAATVAATDRRRAQRSELADRILATEVQRLLDELAASRGWQRTVLVGLGMGEQRVEQVDEDPATRARALKDLHAALATAVRTTVDIDKNDQQPDDAGADDVLDKLFTGLQGVYRAVRGEPAEHPEEAP